MSEKALGVIPARYGSIRFPGKPLAPLAGKPVIQHVFERCTQAVHLGRIVVATDDARIRDAVVHAGGEAMITDAALPSGTDRVAAVAREFPYDVVINIQGDEPLIEPAMIDQVAQALMQDPALPMATLCVRLTSAEALQDPNVVKVTRDYQGNALYFSRAAIPYARNPDAVTYWKHVGIYGYRTSVLQELVSWEPTALECAEQLEQLRALEHGVRIQVLETTHDTVAVDTPEDLARVAEIVGAE